MAGGAGGLHSLKKRIKSIKSTRQVTKAMEAVSASKMRKATAQALASRAYASLGWEVVQGLRHSQDVLQHSLFTERPVKQVLLIVYTSDRGLCGAMNAQLLRQVIQWVRTQQAQSVGVRVITIGKKGQQAMQRLGLTLDQTYVSLGEKPVVVSTVLRPVAATAMELFQVGTVDQVVVAYTDFKSSLSQVPTMKTLLPFSVGILQTIGEEGGARGDGRARVIETPERERSPEPTFVGFRANRTLTEYVFEPGKDQILNTLIPRLVEVQLYQALLESVASEHSSRMLAMRNATDAASEMIGDLTLTYNQARQAGITQEIAEISAGRLAVE